MTIHLIRLRYLRKMLRDYALHRGVWVSISPEALIFSVLFAKLLFFLMNARLWSKASAPLALNEHLFIYQSFVYENSSR